MNYEFKITLGFARDFKQLAKKQKKISLVILIVSPRVSFIRWGT